MKSISIVGANSYIARNLAGFIGQKCPDIKLHLYDREDSHRDGLTCYTPVNLLDKDSVEKIDTDVDALILFVGKTGTMAGFDDYDTFIDINEKSLLNVLDLMRKRSSKAKIIFPSSRLVYKGEDRPLAESDAKEFKTVYAMNKFACENYLAMYNRCFGINYCILRICVPYGTMIEGASSYGTCEMFLKKAKNGENITLYGDGSVRRTLTYIEDLCETICLSALNEKCVNDVYNVGGEDYSLDEMAKKLAIKYGIGVSYTPWPEAALAIESGSTVFDSTKLDGIIGDIRKGSFSKWMEM